MNYITQETAIEVAREIGFVQHSGYLEPLTKTRIESLCNAAIKHYLEAQPKPVESNKAHEIEVGLLLSTINMLTAELKAIKESDENNHCVVVGFTEEGLALVDCPCEGNTISVEEGMILYPRAAAAKEQA